MAAVVVGLPDFGQAGAPAATSVSVKEEAFKPIITRSVAANRIAEIPSYTHELGNDVNWLEFGMESRTRYEYRWDDYGSLDLLTDDALVTRNLLYVGIKHALDPFRLVAEMEDSRRFMSDRIDNPSLEDHWEPLQAYGQLYFDDVFGTAPFSLSFGRMAFDAVDRRLISRNRNRNTINAFDGLRLRLGDEVAPWEVDLFATRPVERTLGGIDSLDKSSGDAMFYGITGYWRKWSPNIVLEPYWLWLDQDQFLGLPLSKNLHTFGLHAYGQWGSEKAWDYDLSVAGQVGSAQELDQRAWAAHVETGYTFANAWKPRLALWLNYATGDRDPDDGSNQRFDPLFGASYAFYGYTSYFSWQNTINPALRLSFAPSKSIKCEICHRGIWLDSANDVWGKAARRDKTGGSGSYVGQETDARIGWQVCKNFDIDIAYAHFFPGSFVEQSGASPQSDFVQIAATVRF